MWAVVVTIPEELVVNETLEFIPRFIEECPAKLSGIIVNRSYKNPDEKLASLSHAESKFQSLKAPVDYLKARIKSVKEIQEHLVEDISKLGLTDTLRLVPEMGLIEEPLGKEFASRFFGESHG